ncbi:hypothetical protein ACE6H2_001976 [Prunus campanulata]
MATTSVDSPKSDPDTDTELDTNPNLNPNPNSSNPLVPASFNGPCCLPFQVCRRLRWRGIHGLHFSLRFFVLYVFHFLQFSLVGNQGLTCRVPFFFFFMTI